MKFTEILYEGRSLGTRFLDCDNVFTRMKGLLGRRSMEGIDGAFITPCNSVHTVCMKFPIDVIYIDAEGRAVRVVASMPPGKASLPCRKARSVIELAAGEAIRNNIVPGGRFEKDDRHSRE